MLGRALTVIALPLSLAAGAGHPAATTDVVAITARADSLYFAFSPVRSLALCEGVFASGVDDARLRWRAGRAAIAIGMLRPDDAIRKTWYDSALVHAHRGLELAPAEVESRYWVAAAAGRRAHRDDPLLSIKLADEVYDQATAILAVDSLHAGAHHAIGALNAEVLRAPRWVRFLAARVLRMDLAGRANWKDAERHLRRAVDLDPEMIQYLVDLADLYARAGRTADADRVFARLTAAPVRHPMDRVMREASLRKWQRAFTSVGR